MEITDLWAIEEGFSQAWPALLQEYVGGWRLKAGGGVSRRTNSANPTAVSRPLLEVLPAIDSFYQAQRLPALVRTLEFQSENPEGVLQAKGYQPEGETRTLYAPTLSDGGASRTTVEANASDRWIEGVTFAQRRTEKEQSIYKDHVSRVNLRSAFASTLDSDGEPVSWGYGAIDAKHLYIESVVTLPDRRRQGHGKKMVHALFRWAKSHGVHTSVLQMQADNEAACRLYKGLGFTDELYRYRYWRQQE
jgi:ribosomal protein S18 acetylase RimI-like enzyme